MPLAATLNYKDSFSTKVYKLYLLDGTGTEKLVQLLKKDQIDFDKPFDSLELLLKKLKEDLRILL